MRKEIEVLIMTINREFAPVTINIYNNQLDEYGVVHNTGKTTKTVDMLIKINNQSNVQDPRYIDCELVALTKDKTIKDSYTITHDNKEYQIKYIIPSPKYLTLLLHNIE